MMNNVVQKKHGQPQVGMDTPVRAGCRASSLPRWLDGTWIFRLAGIEYDYYAHYDDPILEDRLSASRQLQLRSHYIRRCSGMVAEPALFTITPPPHPLAIVACRRPAGDPRDGRGRVSPPVGVRARRGRILYRVHDADVGGLPNDGVGGGGGADDGGDGDVRTRCCSIRCD